MKNTIDAMAEILVNSLDNVPENERDKIIDEFEKEILKSKPKEGE